jgi:hypothetical protein
VQVVSIAPAHYFVPRFLAGLSDRWFRYPAAEQGSSSMFGRYFVNQTRKLDLGTASAIASGPSETPSIGALLGTPLLVANA